MHDAKVVKDSCTLKDFHNALRARDPLGSGFDTSTDLLLHLIWKLLAFSPSDRLTPAQALLHPYFTESEQDGLLSDVLMHGSTVAPHSPVSGFHNELESQLLDQGRGIHEHILAEVSEYTCPKCGKSFADYVREVVVNLLVNPFYFHLTRILICIELVSPTCPWKKACPVLLI
jgi:serine/threonine protein kinase